MTERDTDQRPCGRQADATAWVQGGLSPSAARDFERHIGECPECSRWVNEVRALLGDLGRLPTEAWGASARRRARRLRGAAALLLALLAAGLLWHDGTTRAPAPATAAAPSDPVAWLAEHLQPTGTWGSIGGPKGASTGGSREAAAEGATPGLVGARVGLHGLGLLALIEGSAPGEHGPAIDRATDWLLARQDEGGGLDGPETYEPRAGFDHALATAALLEAADRTGRPDVRAAAERALQYLLADGAGGGAAARLPAGGPAPNAALTAWMLRTLMRADELGYRGPDGPGGLKGAIAAGRVRLAAESGNVVDPGRLDARQVSILALTPQRPTVAAAFGPLYTAAEDALIRHRP